MKFTKKNGGFTLVELIVVIAILAILAAIAVPAYSGYIKKANEAGDQQLLAAVNTAFAAACLEDNQDALSIGHKRPVKININQETGIIESVIPYGEDANGAFWRYFGDNGGFKVFKSLYFNRNAGVFAENVSETFTTSSGLKVPVSEETKYLLENSIWSNEEVGLGAEGVVDQMNLVTGFAEAVLDTDSGTSSGAMDKLFADTDFLKSYAVAMGIKEEELNGLDAEGIQNVIGSIEGHDITPTTMSNAMVLYAAQSAANQNPETVIDLLTSGNAASQIAAMGNEDPSAMLSNAALAYGMYTAYAYANDNGENNLINKAKDPQQALKDIDKDPGFKAYLESEAANADLQAYMAALGTINDAAADPTTAGNLINNGISTTDEDLMALLNTIMGNG